RPDLVAALQLVDESGDGLLAQVAGSAAQVDQIAGVHARRKAGAPRRLAEGLRVLRRDLLRAPHPARLGEDLDGFRAVGEGAGERLVQAAGGGFVGAEEHGGWSIVRRPRAVQGLSWPSWRASGTSRSSGAGST